MKPLINLRFDTIKDLIPDVSLYNYKDPLTSHLHVGAVVMMSIGIIGILLAFGYFIIDNIKDRVTKDGVMLFYSLSE